MSRESAGAAIRALRESRDWSLADLAAATGVSTMGLSYLERCPQATQKHSSEGRKWPRPAAWHLLAAVGRR